MVVELIDGLVDELELVLDEAERAFGHHAVADVLDALQHLQDEREEVHVVLLAACNDDEMATGGDARDGRAKGWEDGELLLARHCGFEERGVDVKEERLYLLLLLLLVAWWLLWRRNCMAAWEKQV